MRSTFHSVLAAGLTTVLTACSDIASPRDAAAGVMAEIRGDALVVRNHLDAPVCYISIEQQYAALVQIVIGGSENCDRVDAHGTLRIPLADISGWNAEARNVILHWWVYGSESHPGPFANSHHTLVAGR
jgi:hypothetical protein